jgi:dipeptidyl aminopeptidase/acylaminoacyl peptidase
VHLRVPGARNTIAWSPDGAALAYSESTGARETTSLALFSLQSRGKSYITPAKEGNADLAPSFSPDGKRIAFARQFNKRAPRGARNYVWFITNGRFHSYSIKDRRVRDLGDLRGLGRLGLSVAPDERSVVGSSPERAEADLMLVEEQR